MTESENQSFREEESQDFQPTTFVMLDGSTLAMPNTHWQQAYEMRYPANAKPAIEALLRQKASQLWDKLNQGAMDVLDFDDVTEELGAVQQARFVDSLLDLIGKRKTWVEKSREWVGFILDEDKRQHYIQQAAEQDTIEKELGAWREEPRDPTEVTHAEIAELILYQLVRTQLMGIVMAEMSGGKSKVIGLDSEGGATVYSDQPPIHVNDADVLFNPESR